MNNAFLSEDSARTQVSWTTPRSRGGARLRRTSLIVLLLMSSGLFADSADAADQARPVRIGALTLSWGPTPDMVGLRDGLQELGYRENEDFVLGVRFTQGDVAALSTAARELVQYGVDLIFVTLERAAKAAQLATTQIPIVFADVSDPLGQGLVHSFAQPGGNITGVTDLTLELGPKRLELFREIIPDLKQVLFLYAAADAPSVAEAQAYRAAARRLDIVLVEKAVRTEEEAQATLAQMDQAGIEGILMPHSLSLNIPGFILEAAARHGLQTMWVDPFWVESGGLASYGSDQYESGRQAARLVDKILKGVDPAEVPVEVNNKIVFAISLKVAKALGLKIAPEVLYRADRIIR